MWDTICFNYLKQHKKVVPPLVKHEKKAAYVGAYVKEPEPGFYGYVASFDVTSEYPSIIMGSNISPETLIEPKDYSDKQRKIFSDAITIDNLLANKIDLDALKKLDVAFTANGMFYRRDKQGFMPAMVEKMFADRKRYKKAMIDAEKKLESATNQNEKNN